MEKQKLKSVVRIERDELARNYVYREGSDTIADNISIISIDEAHKYPELPRTLNIGDTFIQSPFNSSEFWPIDRFENNAIQQKASKMVEIAQLLGVAHFEYTAQLESLQERKMDFKTKGGYKQVDVDLKVTSEKREEIRRKYYKKSDFSNPTKPTKEDYQKAISIARECGLYAEPEINNLLNMCDPENNNQLKHQEVNFDSTSEANSILDIAFGLNVMKGIFNLNAAFEESIRYKKKINIKFKMDF